MTCARLIALAVAIHSLSGTVGAQVLPVGTRFVMSHFKADGGGGDERLYVSHSPDGQNWTALNSGAAVWQPPGWQPFNNVVRDPAITYANGFYWVAYTSGNYGRHDSFGLVKSADLVTWTFVGEIPVPIAGATDPLTWNPVFFEDGDGTFHVFISISPINGSAYNPIPGMRIHETHPLNAEWTQWSAPVAVSLPSTNTNEFWVWKEGEVYHGIYIDFRHGGSPVVHVTALNLLTGWGSPQVLGFHGQEGPMILPKPEGGYRLYAEGGNSAFSPGYRTCDFNAELLNPTPQVAVASTVPMRNGKITSARGTLSFAQWQALHLAGVPPEWRGPLADPDGDALPNQLEHSLAGAPLVFTSPGKPLELWTRREGEQVYAGVRFSWLRSSSDTTVFAEVRRLPATGWSSAPTDLAVESVALLSDGTTRVTVGHPVPLAPSHAVLMRVTGTLEAPLPQGRPLRSRRARR